MDDDLKEIDPFIDEEVAVAIPLEEDLSGEDDTDNALWDNEIEE